MHAVAWYQAIGRGSILELRLVDRSVVIDRPEALDLRNRQNLFIVSVKNVQVLLTADLKEKIAFPVNVIWRDPTWRGNEDQRVLDSHHLMKVYAGEGFKLAHAFMKECTVFRIFLCLV